MPTKIPNTEADAGQQVPPRPMTPVAARTKLPMDWMQAPKRCAMLRKTHHRVPCRTTLKRSRCLTVPTSHPKSKWQSW